MELEISGVSAEGEGVGRLEGKAVFVPGALPGELVTARLLQNQKSMARAALTQVLRPHPQRRQPLCPWYAQCGGCALQHADYDLQLELKQQIVAQTLRRIGGIECETPLPWPSPNILSYRNRATFHAVSDVNGVRLGFYAPNSRRLCPVDDCLLLRPPLRDLLGLVQERLRGRSLPGLREVVLRCNNGGDELLLTLVSDHHLLPLKQVALDLCAAEPRLSAMWECSGPPAYGVYGRQWRLLAGAERLRDQSGSLRLELSPAAFTQVNPEQGLALYQLVQDWAAVDKSQTVLDLYSGAGAIALFLAASAGRVIGVESHAPAVADAGRNAQLNQIYNCQFMADSVERALPRLAVRGVSPAVIVADPPRAGCEPSAIRAILSLSPQRLIYVSCAPATLARDLRLLVSGGYEPTRVQPLDMFSQTSQVETVVLLEKSSGGWDIA